MAELARRLGLPPGLCSRQMVVMCAFALLLHAKPSEPHLVRSRSVSAPRGADTPRQVPYLTGVKGFTNEQVMNDIFPVFTYTDFAFVVLAAPASQARGFTRQPFSAAAFAPGRPAPGCFPTRRRTRR
jgi:hypothetical protein